MKFCKIHFLCTSILLFSICQSPLNKVAYAAPIKQYSEIPKIPDGQSFSPRMRVAATADLESNTPTIITLETAKEWCAGQYFAPNVSRCLNHIGDKNKVIRTEWNLNCVEHTVRENSELTPKDITKVVWGKWSKKTQRAYRTYAYACRLK